MTQQNAPPVPPSANDQLHRADKQATSGSSRFLETCRRFNRGEVSEEELTDATVRTTFPFWS